MTSTMDVGHSELVDHYESFLRSEVSWPHIHLRFSSFNQYSHTDVSLMQSTKQTIHDRSNTAMSTALQPLLMIMLTLLVETSVVLAMGVRVSQLAWQS
jgi:hypothetical protein